MRKLSESLGVMKTFWREVAEETRRCEWPAKDELTESTLIVIVFLLLLAAYIGVCDKVLVEIAKRLFRV
ncbi:MAG: preprotein translocase subunit SecE [Verrucomicrobiota bacterium]|nr:preprotein translocase subunit SecE [Verrucomicrobiota bacterium]